MYIVVIQKQNAHLLDGTCLLIETPPFNNITVTIGLLATLVFCNGKIVLSLLPSCLFSLKSPYS